MSLTVQGQDSQLQQAETEQYRFPGDALAAMAAHNLFDLNKLLSTDQWGR